jgi:hypothetical protein
MGGNLEGVYKHSAGENWAGDTSKSRAWDRIEPHCTLHLLPSTYPLTQEAMMRCLPCIKRINVTSLSIEILMQDKFFPFFPLQVKNKLHDKMQIERLFLNGCGLERYGDFPIHNTLYIFPLINMVWIYIQSI